MVYHGTFADQFLKRVHQFHITSIIDFIAWTILTYRLRHIYDFWTIGENYKLWIYTVACIVTIR